MRALVSIAGHDIPDPSTYAGTTATIVDAARNAAGVTIGAVIRDDVAKVSMTYKYIDAQAWADILALFSPARGGSFYNSVTFYCQDTNAWETRTMYVNDRTANVFLRRDDGSIRGYTNASLNLIQA